MPEHVRRKRRKAEDIIATLPEDTPTEIIEHYLPEDETKCPKCGTQMEIIGKQEYKHNAFGIVEQSTISTRAFDSLTSLPFRTLAEAYILLFMSYKAFK